MGELKIVDFGCGGGRYGPRLLKWSGSKDQTYLGLDTQAVDRWRELSVGDPRMEFKQASASEACSHLPETANLLVSQSAIEHFDDDLSFFAALRTFVVTRQRPTVQVHLFPSAACLRLYHLHGVRQYTPRTISKITALFQPFSYAVLYRLGGRACNRLHYEFITRPFLLQKMGDLRLSRTAEYNRRLRESIECDMRHPQSRPAFWALVVHSHWKTRLFGEQPPILVPSA